MSEGSNRQPQSIVALLPDEAVVGSCLDCAKAAADPFGAAIGVIHIGFDAVKAFASQEEIDVHELLAVKEGAPEARREKVKESFDAWMSRASHCENVIWNDEEGDIGELIVQASKHADLVVMARPGGPDGEDAFHSVLFRSRRMLLVAPRDPSFEQQPSFRHIVVGWKPSDAVKHAASSAVPWLKAADKISVLCVENEGSDSYAKEARDWFASIGLDAEIRTLEKQKSSVGHLLLSEAEAIGGDCLLIGAFAHGEFWEAILGGVTRDVLDTARLPVFMMR